jgi:hypothetical protein
MTGESRARADGKPDIHYCVEGEGPVVTLVHGVGATASASSASTWPAMVIPVQSEIDERFKILPTMFDGSGMICNSPRRILLVFPWVA